MTGEWQDLAACRGHDPKIFCKDGQKGSYQLAKRFCAVCPVIGTCLEAALSEEGATPRNFRACIRGGKTPEERHDIHMGRRPAPAARLVPA